MKPARENINAEEVEQLSASAHLQDAMRGLEERREKPFTPKKLRETISELRASELI